MKFHTNYRLVILLCIGLTSLLFNGCGLDTGAAAPQGSVAEKPAEDTKKTTAVYYDFEDVLIPVEMAVVKGRTTIVSTPGYRSGILTIKGRVESNSLYDFFGNNMEKDNWQVLSTIKSPDTIIMVYQKTSRCAVITIRDEQLYTYVEISVAPTVGGGSIQKSESLTY